MYYEEIENFVSFSRIHHIAQQVEPWEDNFFYLPWRDRLALVANHSRKRKDLVWHDEKRVLLVPNIYIFSEWLPKSNNFYNDFDNDILPF